MWSNTKEQKEIKLCEYCGGSGKELEDAGQGFIIRTKHNCSKCCGSGRLMYTSIERVSSFED